MKYVGYVYKIYCTVTSKIYIGITTRDINIRWNQHKNESKTQGIIISIQLYKNMDGILLKNLFQ